MLQRFHKFHPGLVGAAIGLSVGVLYSIWWLGLRSADVGLDESETKWLLVATVAMIVGFPILIGYFAYFAYPGLQVDPTKSAVDAWHTVAVIVFSLSFGYSLSLVAVFKDPTSISTTTMWALIVGYGAIIVAPLYLIFKFPWAKWGRAAMSDSSTAKAVGAQEYFQQQAKTMETNNRFPKDRECEKVGDE